MSRIFITLSAIFLCISAFAQEISESKVIPFADPFILYEDGLYYLYGTGSDEGIPVVVSKDLKTWSWPEGENMYFALHKDNSFGERMFWAPEVYKVDGRYITGKGMGKTIDFALAILEELTDTETAKHVAESTMFAD